MEKVYGISKDGIKVYAHPKGHPHREDLVAEAISMIEIGDRPFVRETLDFGRVIGEDHLVETEPEDQIIMYRRGNRAGESRMVISRSADDTSFVTCIMCKCDDSEPEFAGKYVVVTLFEGMPGEREPWDQSIQNNPEAKARAEKFWASHALVPTEEEWKGVWKLITK